MTRDEEDAIVLQCTDQVYGAGEWVDIRATKAIRLAIRAAVATERERCARVCEEWIDGERPAYLPFEPLKGWKRLRTNEECAAAIRGGANDAAREIARRVFA